VHPCPRGVLAPAAVDRAWHRKGPCCRALLRPCQQHSSRTSPCHRMKRGTIPHCRRPPTSAPPPTTLSTRKERCHHNQKRTQTRIASHALRVPDMTFARGSSARNREGSQRPAP